MQFRQVVLLYVYPILSSILPVELWRVRPQFRGQDDCHFADPRLRRFPSALSGGSIGNHFEVRTQYP